MGKNILLGVSETAHKGKAAWIGVDGVSRKWKAAWIGVNGIARLCYQSLIKLFATAAFERGGDGATTDDLHAYKSGSGYAVLSWPANDAFENCQKLTLHFYAVSNVSTFGTIALRSGTVENDEYGKSTNISSPIPDFTPTGTGWQSVDITDGLDVSGGVERTVIAENGLKIFLRSNSNTVIGGIGGENCPYVTIDSAASEPETTIGDTVTWDGDMTGRVNVSVNDGMGYLVKVSDSVPQSSDFVNGCQVVDDATAMGEGIVTKDVTAEDAIASFTSDGTGVIVGSFSMVVIVPYAGNVSNEAFGDVSFPESGVYFTYMPIMEGIVLYTTAFTIPGYNFLPASSGGGDVSFVADGDTVTITGATFTQLSDGSVQIDNATFTQQDDESVLIQ